MKEQDIWIIVKYSVSYYEMIYKNKEVVSNKYIKYTYKNTINILICRYIYVQVYIYINGNKIIDFKKELNSFYL